MSPVSIIMSFTAGENSRSLSLDFPFGHILFPLLMLQLIGLKMEGRNIHWHTHVRIVKIGLCIRDSATMEMRLYFPPEISSLTLHRLTFRTQGEWISF